MALSKIKTGSITDSAVTTAKIADGTIVDADVNDVAATKLSGTVADARFPATLPTASGANLTSLPAASLTGTVADARISTLAASKLTGALPAISGANLTGITTDMTPIRQDINTLALHSAISDNKAAYNLTDSFIDQFEDDTGIGSEVTTDRQADDEYVSSITMTTEPNTLALWTFPDATTTVGDCTGVEYIDDLGNLKIVENGDKGQEIVTDGKFNGYRALHTSKWPGNYEADLGFQVELVAGKTHPLDFGTGPFTIELFSKDINTSNPWQYETLWEINDGSTTFSTPKAWYSGQATSYLDGTVIPGNYPYCADWMHHALHVTSWVHSAYCRDASGNHSFWINGGHTGSYGTGSALAPNSGTAYRDWSRTTTYLRDQDFTGANAYVHIGVNGAKQFGQYADYSMIRFSNIARYDPTQTSITVPTEAFVGQSGVANATGTVTGIANVPTTTNQTEVSGVMLYKDNEGTATIGGGSYDLKIEFTCDGGSNWTEAAGYTAVTPLFSTGVKMVKLAKTTCTAGNDVRYRAVFANQASGSKETQLHGIAINY
jgi:hypothetical protein